MAVDNLRQLEIKLDRIAKDLPAKTVVLLHKKIHFDLIKRISVKTPVDTGRALGNWQSTINNVADGEIDTAGSRREQSGRVFGQAQEALKTLPPFVVTHITNNVPYARYLEQGSSKQAPHGMVALSVEELKVALGAAAS